VTTVVVGIIAITTGFKLTRRPFLRDILSYLGAVIYIFCMIVRVTASGLPRPTIISASNSLLRSLVCAPPPP